jgi:transcriptional regulator GlxA family with amidase domain
MKPITNEDLQAARLEVERTREPHDEALKARQALVKRALEQGMRPAHVARHVGLSPQRVDTLAKSGFPGLRRS